MLEAAELMPGWRVLDAGCGSGSYLPALRAKVLQEGCVLSLDTSFDNVSYGLANLDAVIDLATVGTISALPFAADSLDAVWCANTLQFLDEGELLHTLQEFTRVVRPGGTVAVKDVDMTGFRLYPAPPLLASRLAQACIMGGNASKQSFGSLRGRDLHAWLRGSGLEDVKQQSFLIERFSPLDAATTQLLTEWLPYLAGLAAQRGVPQEDMVVWRRLATPELALDFIQQPDFYCCELQVVATGRVVEETRR
jgi:ubiquinone/menaquinone biosynthesis C-methylase UbiE